MEQQIRFCTTSDGVRIAYTTLGEGPPLVWAPLWVSNVKLIEHDSQFAAFAAAMGVNRRLILLDQRGSGMSDREVNDFSRQALAKDIEAVVDTLKLGRVALFSIDFACRAALEYAFRNPERVSRVILYAPYVRGKDLAPRERLDAVLKLIRSGWDLAVEIIPVLIMPGTDPETQRNFFEALRESCSAESAASWLEACFREDLTELLPRINLPTLVLHPHNDRMVSFESGRELAALLPRARLVALDRMVHAPYVADTTAILAAINEFLATPKRRANEKPQPMKTAAASPLTILFTDMEGSTGLTQRLGDASAQELLRAHNTILRDALKAHGGSEIKHTGDGIMASFPTASRALECAIAIQRAVAAHVEQHTDSPLGVHIGLNAGEPVAEEEDLFGTAVQLAARVCAHAEPGQILASNVVRELAAGKGFLFSDQGDIALRGFEDPVRLWEVRWRED